MDPNYLLSNRVQDSPFHRVLHAWAIQNTGKPLLHIDIHGKLDRKDNYELDLGVQSVYRHFAPFGEQEFMDAFINQLTFGFTSVLSSLPKYKDIYSAICQPDPILHGLWGGDLRTMTE